MENSNADVVQGQVARPPSRLLPLSLSANVVLAILAIALGIWGWTRHERTKELNRMVADADQKAAAAIEERDEAWQTSRDLQNGLINAKGLIKGMSEPYRQQQPQTGDDDDPSPP